VTDEIGPSARRDRRGAATRTVDDESGRVSEVRTPDDRSIDTVVDNP
jgi:YD repeat-containing protein